MKRTDEGKTCSKCGTFYIDGVVDANFTKNKSSADGLDNTCRSCNAKKPTFYRSSDERPHIARKVTFYKKVKSMGCVTCGCKWESAVDFHHVTPAEGNVPVSRLLGKTVNMDRFIVEMEKCVLLCACCHRLVEAGEISIPNSAKFAFQQHLLQTELELE